MWALALREADVAVEDVVAVPVSHRAGRLVEDAMSGLDVVWFASPDADPGLTDALAEHLARHAVAGSPPELEVLTGSHDVPGARLLDLVAVMDRLRSPGGCPWDAQQTHASLVPYLLEETHEVIEAISTGEQEHLAEELGDLLLQVAFHARIAEEHAAEAFDIDAVAGGIVAKLVRRHPHVFGDVEAATPDEVQANWDELKAAEKQRSGVFDGIPATLPSLARAQKMLARLSKANVAAEEAIAAAAADDDVAARLLAAVRSAATDGTDAESALRDALHRLTRFVQGTMQA